MEWIKQLPYLDLKENKYSQYGEEVIADFIFKQIGTTNKILVDIGAGGAGKGLSNSKYFIEKWWGGLLFDMDGLGENIIKVFVKPSNIVELLTKKECPKEFDFLSVDIDSFDFDVIDNLLNHFRPRLVCAEYNGTLDPLSCVKLKYEEGYTWDGTNKYGFSFGAGLKLFKKHGYTVILNHRDTNIFAIQNEILPEELRNNIEIPAKKNIYHAVNPQAIFIGV